MQSPFTRASHDASGRSTITLPAVFLLSSILAYLGTPTKHSLLISAVAWLSICTYTTLRVGAKSLLDAAPSQKLSWAAGGLLALASVQERSVDGKGIWWAKALLPLIVLTIGKTGLFDVERNTSSDTTTGSDKPSAGPVYTSTTPLYVLTACGVAATYISSGSNTTLSIGLAYATLTALALRLVQRATSGSQSSINGRTIYSTNGFLAQPEHTSTDTASATLTVLRDVSVAAAIGTGVASLIIEGFSTGGLSYWGLLGSSTVGMGVFGQMLVGAVYGAAMVLLHMAMYATLLLLVSLHLLNTSHG